MTTTAPCTLEPATKIEVDAALQEYANLHGLYWKQRLVRDDWPRCAPAGWLITLRNRVGAVEYVEASEIRPMAAAKPATIEALRALATRLGGRLDAFYGPSNLTRRVEALNLIAGVEGYRTPRHKATWGRFRAAIYRALGVSGDCEAAREREFERIVREGTGS